MPRLDDVTSILCGPPPTGWQWLPGSRYVSGWCMVGLGTWHRRVLSLLGCVWFVGAQCVTIHLFTEGAYDQEGHFPARCASSAPERDTVAHGWLLCGPHRWKLELLSFAYFLPGWFAGAWAFGLLSDQRGRRPALLVSLALGTGAYVVSAVAWDFWVYILARICCGAGFGGSAIVAYVLGCEVTSSEWASVVGVGIFNVWFISGEVVMVFVAMLFKGPWQMVTWLSAGQSVALLPLVWLLAPESPRWLLARGRTAEAYQVLLDAAKSSGKDAELPEDTLEGLASDVPGGDGEASAVDYGSFKEDGAPPSKMDKGGFMLLWSDPRMASMTATMIFLWFSASCAYYGLMFAASDLPGSAYLNAFILAAVEFPGTMLGNVLVDVPGVGRQWSVTCFFSASAVALLLAALLPAVAQTVSFVGKLFGMAAFSALFIYAAEIFPTPARNVAIGFCSQVARVGSGTATLLLVKCGGRSALAVFGALSFAASVLCKLTLPETLGRPMPDTVADAVRQPASGTAWGQRWALSARHGNTCQ